MHPIFLRDMFSPVRFDALPGKGFFCQQQQVSVSDSPASPSPQSQATMQADSFPSSSHWSLIVMLLPDIPISEQSQFIIFSLISSPPFQTHR